MLDIVVVWWRVEKLLSTPEAFGFFFLAMLESYVTAVVFVVVIQMVTALLEYERVVVLMAAS
jgi:hypothetical protein